MAEKDFMAIAKIIADTRQAMNERCKWFHAVQTIECKLRMYFEQENRDFDSTAFMAACIH